MGKVEQWTIKEIDEAEAAFVAWFKKKYRREPSYRDVEKRWKDFELAVRDKPQGAHG
jgi:broad specificity phosphatase PhoE